MNPNPYDTLGVPKDADADTISKAHRRKAKKSHPDAGGSAEEFRKVNEAYVVLRDPARRQRYDETGESEPPKNNAETDLIKLFTMVIEEMPEELDHVNPLNVVRKIVRDNQARMRNDQVAAERKAAKLRKAAKKVIRKHGENFFSVALENRAVNEDNSAANLKLGQEQGNQMLALLDEFDYAVKTPQMPSLQDLVSATMGGHEFKNFFKM